MERETVVARKLLSTKKEFSLGIDIEVSFRSGKSLAFSVHI